MKMTPKSGSDWFALALLPFKVFVPTGWLMVTIKRNIIGYRQRKFPDAPKLVR